MPELLQPKLFSPTRTRMLEREPAARRRSFDEVSLGYTPEQARLEARRCMNCKKAPCMAGCPVNVDIRAFIQLLADGQFAAAAGKIKEANALPAVCGRVCPQESQCEAHCTLGKKFEPVAIGRLERFAADYQGKSEALALPAKAPATGKRIAVIGSGPAGLTVAGDLVLRGHEVTIFEAFHQPGGVLVYGIPEFRLPKEIVRREIDGLARLGVKFRLNWVVGQSITVDELLAEQEFDAVFIGVGAGLPQFLHVPGEDLGGIYSASEYLTRANLMKAYLFPEYDTPLVRGSSVCVIGGGNVAMDAARTALRLGAHDVRIVYRRSRAEFPARAEEVHHAAEEGVVFELLANPIAFHGDSRGRVCQVQCVRMELGQPDESGRRRPQAVAGSEVSLDADLVIVAVGS